MAEFFCIACNESIEIVGADGRQDEICECGATLMHLEEALEADHGADRFRLHEAFRGG